MWKKIGIATAIAIVISIIVCGVYEFTTLNKAISINSRRTEQLVQSLSNVSSTITGLNETYRQIDNSITDIRKQVTGITADYSKLTDSITVISETASRAAKQTTDLTSQMRSLVTAGQSLQGSASNLTTANQDFARQLGQLQKEYSLSSPVGK